MASNERGQAILLVVVAMGLVLAGALGLAIDGSQYFTQRTMAQAAADAAAEAGMMSIFDGTNTGINAYGSAQFNCATNDVRTPCAYARLNGFGSTTDDTVTVDFPTSAPGVSLSGVDPVNLVRVTISRNFSTSFMRLLGSNTATIKAAATAAIVSQSAPIPIVITHPFNSGVLSINGTQSTIKICGGPSKSIQINSTSDTTISISGNNTVNLSNAGKDDDGFCNTGTGGDLGVWGGPSTYPGNISLGTRPGRYIPGASPVLDPLASVPAPSRPTNTGTMGTITSLSVGSNGCPGTAKKPCDFYHPGYWTQISLNNTAVFEPGVYYVDGGGFSSGANNDINMSTGLASDTDTGQGILVYLAGDSSFSVGGGSLTTMTGSLPTGKYKGILFFRDRNGSAQTHTLGGNGAMSISGTIYVNNTAMTASKFQTLALKGGSGSGTVLTGEIITGALSLGGNGSITMNLSPVPVTTVREIALIK